MSLHNQILTRQQRDEVILSVLRAIDGGQLRKASPDNGAFCRGWQERLDDILANGFSPEKIIPSYFRNDNIVRNGGDYFVVNDPFQRDQEIRKEVFAQHLQGAGRIVDLGCGTGLSEMILDKLYPLAEFICADYAPPCLTIIREVAAHLGRIIRQVQFDMRTMQGWNDLPIDSNTHIITVHSLEQLGGDWGLLLAGIRQAKPKLCVHIEPILELYDEGNLFDYLAAQYHRARDYLEGWLPAIQQLERDDKAEIIRCERLHFGGRFHEAYSVLVWRPL